MDPYQQPPQQHYRESGHLDRPQPRPHQHHVSHSLDQLYQPQLTSNHSLSYVSDASSSGWNTPGVPSYFDEPSSDYSTDPSSASSFSNSQSSGESMPLQRHPQHLPYHPSKLQQHFTATSPQQQSFAPEFYQVQQSLSAQPSYMSPAAYVSPVQYASPQSIPSEAAASPVGIIDPSVIGSPAPTYSSNYRNDYSVEQQQFQSMMNQAGMLEQAIRPRGASFSVVPPGLVDQSSLDSMGYSDISDQPMSRSSSITFSHDPGGFGMMGPPPRPSQRAALTSFNMPYQQQARHELNASNLSPQQQQQVHRSPQPRYQVQKQPVTSPSNTSQVYSMYGSSYISANQVESSQKTIAPLASSFSMNPTSPSDPFDAKALGLPVPAKTASSTNYTGVYSTSGFDIVSVLAKVANRPNPQLSLGPIDLGCSFVVVDAKKWDQPIVFASETFSRLTGYSTHEIIGRNCRFLQAPDGVTVRQGEKRKYTDGNAAYHLRRHLITGQESQASLINYCKGGKPFINLVTLIPITWDSDEITYYVGFQVDLVEQPAAIMDKMRDGSYIVNYSLSARTIPPAIELSSIEPFGDMHPTPGSPTTTENDAGVKLLEEVVDAGAAGLTHPGRRKMFNRMLLEHCDDFVHVLSLKGSLLYVSASAKRMLEYEPSELFGKGLSSICHPSDIVSVLRELKDAASATGPINIVYRVRRKTSGYMWMEASGQLHLEQGKGRKCVILVGRPRDVYKMSWADLERNSGFGSHEFWSKLSLNGLYLYATPAVQGVTGYTTEEMTGKTVAELSANGDDSAVRAGLDKAASGTMNTVRHQLRGAKDTLTDVVTHFYPSRSDSDVSQTAPTSPTLAHRRPLAVIAQTNLFSSEVTKSRKVTLPSAPSSRMSAVQLQHVAQQHAADPGAGFTLPSFASSGTSSGSGSDEGSASPPGAGPSRSAAFSAIPSTFKTLSQANVSDNIFDELDSVRGTSWQFELHQIRLTNRKLREEKETLLRLQRSNKKRKRNDAPGDNALLAQYIQAHTDKKFLVVNGTTIVASPAASSIGSAGKAGKGGRSCANCGRSHSAEWRTGPTGPKTLCNACGLRWSKAKSAALSPSASTVATKANKPSAASSTHGSATSPPSRAATDSSSGASDSSSSLFSASSAAIRP